MINMFEVNETNKMIEEENLDVRTITMGISLLDCTDSDLQECCRKVYEKVTRMAKDLVKTGEEISMEYGIPIVNKRISVTPVALVGGAACRTPEDFVQLAKTLDRAAHEVGVNFIGGYSALVSKGMTAADELLIRSIPQALTETERVCSSVNLGSTKTGINMDAVRLMGTIIRETAKATEESDSLGCAKLVVFCNAPDDNPFMAGAFHGVTEADAVINVGVSGPGVVKCALEQVRGQVLRQKLDGVVERFLKIIQGAALMSDVTFDIKEGDRLANKIPVLKLNDLLMENARLVGAPRISPPREKTGSSDFSNVMYQLPGSCIRVAMVPAGTSSHSIEFLNAGKTDEAHEAVMVAAKVLAGTGLDLIEDEAKLAAIQEEFHQNQAVHN